ncbi:hypothetical protein JZ751_029108 [Albula glossodonta]|uniref:CW-type domain-containing protein n=1 Tax=Albula glossodonta TaxID=121402 RepID=A0A8T2PC48_9TELE|nr:hypothetical protein JZ751_029108 [Albula glossodonta]
MASQKDKGIPLSALNPKFLHTNSTSHTWPFSAIAELIDNAYDPDVRAKQFWIDWTRINGRDCLTFMDNGAGMTRNRMHKMLSFGFSDKHTVKGHVPVGLYGNGFKSGSMRLGKDAIVFSKTRDTMSVGLLSQSYLATIRAQHVIVPIVTFRRYGQNQVEGAASLQAILKHSLFKTERDLFSELRVINATGTTGTRIIIWNLRRTTNGETEFDFNTDRYDIQIRADMLEAHGAKHKQLGRNLDLIPESEYSLRAYCSILYLKPRMQIIIRGQKVRTQLISKSLAYIANDNYRPAFLSKRIRITFGYNTKSKEQYGIMMYHRNRLIKAYERVGCQRKADSRGVGVIGVIECSFLQPTHNKQDFDNTDKYRKTMHNLGVKLEGYWNEIRYKRKKEDPKCTTPIEDAVKFPDQSWVQCDACLKWRRLPDGIDCDLLPDKWFCQMNPDPQFSCDEIPAPSLCHLARGRTFLDTAALTAFAGVVSGGRTVLGPVGDVLTNAALLTPFHWAMQYNMLTMYEVKMLKEVEISKQLIEVQMGVKRKLAARAPVESSAGSFAMATAASPTPWPAASIRGQTDRKPVVRGVERKGQVETEAKRESAGVRAEEVEGEMGLDMEGAPWPEEEWDDGQAMLEGTEITKDGVKAAAMEAESEEEEGQEKKEQWLLLEEQQEQQDRLLELMEAASQERDRCREQVQQLQQEVEELKTRCATLESRRRESSQLSRRLESVEAERASLSSQCEQLKRELEDLRREAQDRASEDYRLSNLRRSIGRLLVTFVPALDLNQVDFNSDIIDEILDRVLYEIT